MLKLCVLDIFETTVMNFGGVSVFVNSSGVMYEFQWEKTVNVNFVSIKYGF